MQQNNSALCKLASFIFEISTLSITCKSQNYPLMQIWHDEMDPE